MGIFGNKFKLSDETLELIQKAVQITGASSVEEYIEQVLKYEAQKVITEAGKGDVSQAEIDDIANKLKGLGYLE